MVRYYKSLKSGSLIVYSPLKKKSIVDNFEFLGFDFKEFILALIIILGLVLSCFF